MYTADSVKDVLRPLKNRQQLSPTSRMIGVGWTIVFAVALTLVLVSDLLLTPPRLKAGDVSPMDVVAPHNATYLSPIRTTRAQDAAAARVEPVYSPPDRSQVFQQSSTAQAIADYISAVRGDSYSNAEQKAAMIAALEDVQFSPEAVATTLGLTDQQWQSVITETRRILDTTMRREIREGQAGAVRRGIANQIGVDLSEAQADVVEEWVSALVVPNSFLDEERTEAARQQARAQVTPAEATYAAGQIILRRGEIVSPEHVEALEMLGLQQKSAAFHSIIGTALFSFLLVVLLSFYLYRLHPVLWGNQRYIAAIGGITVALAISAKVLVSIGGALVYLVPGAAGAMLLAVLISAELATTVALVLALVVGFSSNSLELATYTFIGGVIAALSLHRVERLAEFVRAGVLVALANLAVVLSFGLIAANRVPMELFTAAGAAVVNGVVAASLTLAGFYVLSNVLGITTFLQLMELARPSTPLFKELLIKAPGTYHHSVIVSNLAERAAEEIGADLLLVRVGAYYHDIGKTINPHFFVENQSNGHNPHDTLDDPQKSARVIIDHVTEGLKLARKHRLPPRIIDFIVQHHGTSVVHYFHHQACDQAGCDLPKEDFRYPGPRPQSREAAILMLADSVEAAARATKPDGPGAVDALVRRLIAKRLAEGELDESDLALRDIERISRAFTEVLQGIYHPRIQYPGEERATLPTDESGVSGDPAAREGGPYVEPRGSADRRALGATS